MQTREGDRICHFIRERRTHCQPSFTSLSLSLTWLDGGATNNPFTSDTVLAGINCWSGLLCHPVFVSHLFLWVAKKDKFEYTYLRVSIAAAASTPIDMRIGNKNPGKSTKIQETLQKSPLWLVQYIYFRISGVAYIFGISKATTLSIYLVYKLANFDLLPDYAKPIFYFLTFPAAPLYHSSSTQSSLSTRSSLSSHCCTGWTVTAYGGNNTVRHLHAIHFAQ